MEILGPIYIICLAIGVFFAVNYGTSQSRKLVAKDYLIMLGFVFFNLPFIAIVTVMYNNEKKAQAKTEELAKEELKQRLEAICLPIGINPQMLSSWRVRDLYTRGSENESRRLLYFILKDLGKSDSEHVNSNTLLDAYDLFTNPPIVLKLRAQYNEGKDESNSY